MRATVAILGLVPLRLARGVGAEAQRPLTTVVAGGLFTSTLLTLFIHAHTAGTAYDNREERIHEIQAGLLEKGRGRNPRGYRRLGSAERRWPRWRMCETRTYERRAPRRRQLADGSLRATRMRHRAGAPGG